MYITFYCGAPWAFHIIILKMLMRTIQYMGFFWSRISFSMDATIKECRVISKRDLFKTLLEIDAFFLFELHSFTGTSADWCMYVHR